MPPPELFSALNSSGSHALPKSATTPQLYFLDFLVYLSHHR